MSFRVNESFISETCDRFITLHKQNNFAHKTFPELTFQNEAITNLKNEYIFSLKVIAVLKNTQTYLLLVKKRATKSKKNSL